MNQIRQHDRTDEDGREGGQRGRGDEEAAVERIPEALSDRLKAEASA